MRRLLALLVSVFCACAWHQSHAQTEPPAAPPAFLVFDGLLNPDKPNLAQYGMIEFRGTGNVWRPGVSIDTVDEPGIESVVRFMATLGPGYYLDIENWPVVRVPEAEVQANVGKLVQVAQIARRTAPERDFGFYGLLPHAVYWEVLLNDQAALADWRRSNELSRPMADHVDFVLPSIYTFYEDREGWKRAALVTLEAARQFGKPVYAFIWWEYHEGNPKLAGQPLPRDYWRMQLEFVREHADGVVIWGGYQKAWDPNAPWWLETQDFLQTLQ